MEKLTSEHKHLTNTENQFPTSLITAKIMASELNISTERLIDLVNSHFAPHWRIDGGEPLFQRKEMKQWAAKNLVTHFNGMDFPINIKIMIPPPLAINAPASIREIQNLRVLPTTDIPGVYFLVYKEDVVYIGQSKTPSIRIREHKDKNFDSVFFLPIPSFALNEVEGALIRILRPRLNGIMNNGEISAPGNEFLDKRSIEKYCEGLKIA